MSLIVETGAMISNANTLVGVADYRAWLSLRGEDVDLEDELRSQELIKAMDFMEELDWLGCVISQDQPLRTMPRDKLRNRDGFDLPSNVVPQDFINAQIEIARRFKNGFDPNAQNIQADGKVKREVVDVLETEYFDSGAKGDSTVGIHSIPRAYRLLNPYLDDGLSLRINRA